VDSIVWLQTWIQNVADPQWNGCVRKDFELSEPRFRSQYGSDFRIKVIFPCRDRSRNRDRSRILNPWLQVYSMFLPLCHPHLGCTICVHFICPQSASGIIFHCRHFVHCVSLCSFLAMIAVSVFLSYFIAIFAELFTVLLNFSLSPRWTASLLVFGRPPPSRSLRTLLQ